MREYIHERDVAVRVATEAGALLADWQPNTREVAFKGRSDLVTDADRASDELITARLLAAFPGDELLTEESGRTPSTEANGRTWIVDPLDGTTNYTHGFPLYAVSIALVVDGVAKVGAVVVPPLGETFDAVHGAGTRLNGLPVQVSDCHEIEHALLASGFAYEPAKRLENMGYWERFALMSRATRRIGSAAYDLCCVACGRFDGYWERGPFSWDLAAGSLIVAEAGGVVSSYNGDPFDIYAREILASAPGIHAAMSRLLTE